MAEVKDKEVVVKGALDLGWTHRALQTQRDALLRQRNKEMTGSDIWVLRGKEIELLNNLIARFST